MKKKHLIYGIVAFTILLIGIYFCIVYIIAFQPSLVFSISNQTIKVENGSLMLLSVDCCSYTGNTGCRKDIPIQLKMKWNNNCSNNCGFAGIWELKISGNNHTDKESMNQGISANEERIWKFPLISIPSPGEYNITLTEYYYNITFHTVCIAK